MRKQISIGIIGGLAIGTVAYILVKHKKERQRQDCNTNSKTYDENSVEFSTVEIVENDADSIKEARIKTASSIYNRHAEAAKVIGEIMNDANENIETSSEHKDEFDSILDELDILTKER